MAVSNLRYPKVFVFDPSTEFIVDGSSKPTDLTLGQVGFFDPNTGLAAASSVNPDDVAAIIVHQNVGDSKHGTMRSTIINRQKVRRWYAIEAANGVDQKSYIGYDESDTNKKLTAYKGQTIEFAITVFNNELTKWYGPRGYTHRIVIDLATACIPCQADCDLLDQEALADWIVAHINGTDAPSGGWPVTLELSNWITAAKVSSGSSFGVKLTAKTPTIELIDKANPQQFYKAQLTTFVVAMSPNCPNWPITYTTKAKTGNGYPLELLDLEKESQGYDRVRESFEDVRYMKTNYYTRATDGKKYDFYYLEFDKAHQDSGIPKEISDPYTVIFACVNDKGKALEDWMTLWLAKLGFPAVDITGAANKGAAAGAVDNA